jgi:hypothetical protein
MVSRLSLLARGNSGLTAEIRSERASEARAPRPVARKSAPLGHERTAAVFHLLAKRQGRTLLAQGGRRIRRSARLVGPWCRHRGARLVKDTERVVLEEFHDAANPGVAARGAAGEGEVVSLDCRMDRLELQALW